MFTDRARGKAMNSTVIGAPGDRHGQRMLAAALDRNAQRHHVPAMAADGERDVRHVDAHLVGRVGDAHGHINRKQRMPLVPDNRAS